MARVRFAGIAALLLGAAAALAPPGLRPARAESLTGIPESLAEGLQEVRDGLDPGAGGTTAARIKSLDKALTVLSKPSATVDADISLLAGAAKALRKAFGTSGDVPDLVEEAGVQVGFEVDFLLSTVFLRSRETDDLALRAVADRLRMAGNALMDRASRAASMTARLNLLRKASRKARKALDYLEGHGVGPPPPPPVRMTATVGAYAFKDASAAGTWTTASGALDLRGLDTSTALVRDLRINIPGGVTGPGTYDLTGVASYREGFGSTPFVSTSGSLVITALDGPGRRLTGTFSFTAQREGGQRSVTGGVVDYPDLNVK